MNEEKAKNRMKRYKQKQFEYENKQLEEDERCIIYWGKNEEDGGEWEERKYIYKIKKEKLNE